jgi:uncharacterized RmlC-like cupin family protein
MATTSGCVVVHHAGDLHEGKQGLAGFVGICAETAGAQGLSLLLQTVPPGGRAKAHLHADHETAIYVVSGEAVMYYGHDLAEVVVCRPGDFVYLAAGVPHLPINRSQTEPCVAVIARSDPHEQESVVLRPDLDARVP